ncbi:MAG: hypothetical protein NXI21_05320 [Alphaproteobacteria bacterium]|nr:hypothetical protein [Alphaproteobacteria bacterium]
MGARDTQDKALCRTPTPGKQPVRIPRWKYDRVRAAVLDAILAGGSLAFRDLRDAIAGRIPPAEAAHIGSLSWHATTVKLDLEARGLVRRLPGRGPQRLALAPDGYRPFQVDVLSPLAPEPLLDRLLSADAARGWSAPLGVPETIEIAPWPGGRLFMRHRRGEGAIEHDGMVLADTPPGRVSLLWDVVGAAAPDYLVFTASRDRGGARLTLDGLLHPRWAAHLDGTRKTWRALLDGVAAPRDPD